jgi:hypothetical protein
LPAVHTLRVFAASGGLISYGIDSADLFRRGASYIDRILKGAKPAELPVQQPTKFDLVINLKNPRMQGGRISSVTTEDLIRATSSQPLIDRRAMSLASANSIRDLDLGGGRRDEQDELASERRCSRRRAPAERSKPQERI